MKVIWKFPIALSADLDVVLPRGAQLLHADVQGGIPCIWALVDDSAEKVTRSIMMRGTGHPIENEDAIYFATFQMGAFVWHLFDLGEAAAE